jgi:hypothetical protein
VVLDGQELQLQGAHNHLSDTDLSTRLGGRAAGSRQRQQQHAQPHHKLLAEQVPQDCLCARCCCLCDCCTVRLVSLRLPLLRLLLLLHGCPYTRLPSVWVDNLD